MGGKRKKPDVWFVVAAVLVAGFTAATRIPAPWRMNAINDEMLHLRSFRVRYGEEQIFPLFLQKVELLDLLDERQLEVFRGIYEGSQLLPHAMIILTDLHPPLFPALTQVIAVVTDSSLTAIRIPPMVGSLLAVLFMYRLGRELRDPALGLWLAALLAIGTLTQIYAGIARPYAIVQFGVVLLLWTFVRGHTVPHRAPWRMWLAALFTQCTNWPVWSLVGPLVLTELIRRHRAGSSVGLLFRQTWWYALASTLLLPIMVLQLMNPTTQGLTGGKSLWVIWHQFSVASPFANLYTVFDQDRLAVLDPAGIALFLAMLTGVAAVVADPEFVRTPRRCGLHPVSVRWGLLVSLGSVFLMSVLGASAIRMALVYVLVPTVFAGIGLRWLMRPARVSQAAVATVVISFAVLRFGWPEDPYERVLMTETDYAPIAERIAAELADGDEWIAFRRPLADCVYRYADLPEPLPIIADDEFDRYVEQLPRDSGAAIILVNTWRAEQWGILRRARYRWDFRHRFTVVKIPPRPRSSRRPRD